MCYSPVAIRLIDAFSLSRTIGRISLVLQQETAAGSWQDRDELAFRSAGDVFSYPGIGRAASVDSVPGKHRVLVDSDYYEPYVPQESETFLIHPFNDSHPLEKQQYATSVRDVLLWPNSRYPYDTHVPVITGRVISDGGATLPGVELQHQSLKVFSDRNGEFVLPVRFPAQDTVTTSVSFLNSIAVQNARGFAKAVIGVEGLPGAFRVFEIIWVDASDPANYAATLAVDPIAEGNDLPAGLPAQAKVTLISSAILIDIPPYAPRDLDQVFDISPRDGFTKFHSVLITSSP